MYYSVPRCGFSFLFILFGVCWASYICWLMLFTKFRIFSALFFQTLFFYSTSPFFWDSKDIEQTTVNWGIIFFKYSFPFFRLVNFNLYVFQNHCLTFPPICYWDHSVKISFQTLYSLNFRNSIWFLWGFYIVSN